MAHLRHEYRHPRALVAVIEREFHLIALRIKRRDIVVKFVARNEETFEFPFYTHEKHTVYLIHILVEVDNITFIISDKLSHFRDDTLLVRAV